MVNAIRTAAPVQPFSVFGRIVDGMKPGLVLRDISNRPSDAAGTSSLSHCSGAYHRTAAASAQVHAAAVMQEAVDSGTYRGSKREALEKSIAWAKPGGEVFGPHAMRTLVVLGALHAGVRGSLAQNPLDAGLTQTLQQLRDAIVEIGLTGGKFSSPPDGTLRGDIPATRQLSDAIEAAKASVTNCMQAVGAESVLASVASALVADPLLRSIADRLPEKYEALRQDKAEGFAIHDLLERTSADNLRAGISFGLGEANFNGYSSAVMDLLTVPELVKQPAKGEGPGGDERAPAPAADPHVPLSHLKALLDGSRSVHYAPVTVSSDQKVNESFLEALNTALDRQFERGVAHGRVVAELAFVRNQLVEQQAENAGLRQENDTLQSRFATKQLALQRWADGDRIPQRADVLSMPDVGREKAVALGDAPLQQGDAPVPAARAAPQPVARLIDHPVQLERARHGEHEQVHTAASVKQQVADLERVQDEVPRKAEKQVRFRTELQIDIQEPARRNPVEAETLRAGDNKEEFQDYTHDLWARRADRRFGEMRRVLSNGVESTAEQDAAHPTVLVKDVVAFRDARNAALNLTHVTRWAPQPRPKEVIELSPFERLFDGSATSVLPSQVRKMQGQQLSPGFQQALDQQQAVLGRAGFSRSSSVVPVMSEDDDAMGIERDRDEESLEFAREVMQVDPIDRGEDEVIELRQPSSQPVAIGTGRPLHSVQEDLLNLFRNTTTAGVM